MRALKLCCTGCADVDADSSGTTPIEYVKSGKYCSLAYAEMMALKLEVYILPKALVLF